MESTRSWAFKRSDPCPEEAMAGMIHPHIGASIRSITELPCSRYVLSTRSPIVESSALIGLRIRFLFNHLRLGRRLRSMRHWIRCRRGVRMLRITRTANGEVVFKVSGQLTAENVTEMDALIAAETKGRRIVLDCAD